MDLVSTATALIATDTSAPNGTRAAVALLARLYESAGLRVRVDECHHLGIPQANILATREGDNPGGLALVTHLDTRSPGDTERWADNQGKPLQLRVDGDRLYGLGTADSKLAALCQLEALTRVQGRLKRSVHLVGTFGEELGWAGAQRLLETRLATPEFAVCSQPTGLSLLTGQRGHAIVSVEIQLRDVTELDGPFERTVYQGLGVHSSRAHEGVNAIEQAVARTEGPVVSLEGGLAKNMVPAQCQVVRRARADSRGERVVPADVRDGSGTMALASRLYALWKRLCGELVPAGHPRFAPAHVLTTWTMVRLAGPRAELVFDARLLPGQDPQGLVAAFTHEAAAAGTSARGQVLVAVDRAVPATELAEQSELYAAAAASSRALGLPDAPTTSGAHSEAGVFTLAGIPSLVFGPGMPASGPHEHQLLSQMEKAIGWYQALITRLCTA